MAIKRLSCEGAMSRSSELVCAALLISLAGCSGASEKALPVTPVLPAPRAAVATVGVSPDTGTLFIGRQRALVARLTDTNGTPVDGRTVTWASASPAVAGVNDVGLVTAVSAGSAVITATSEGRAGSALITVVPVPVATVAIRPARTAVAPGGAVTVVALPADSANGPLLARRATWSVDDSTIARVSQDGVVTGILRGRTTVRATVEGKSAAAGVDVTDPCANVVSLPVGAHKLIPLTAASTCVALPEAGTYGVMVYAWDHRQIYGGSQPGPLSPVAPVPLTLEVQPHPAVAGTAQRVLPFSASAPSVMLAQQSVRTERALMPNNSVRRMLEHRVTSVSSDSDAPTLRAVSAASCAVPSQFGDTVWINTGRGTNPDDGKPAILPITGSLVGANMTYIIEPWRLRLQTADFTIFVDSTTWRRYEASQGRADTRLARFFSIADTSVGAARRAFLPGPVSVNEGDGRLIIYMSADGAWKNTWVSRQFLLREECRAAGKPVGSVVTLARMNFDDPSPSAWTDAAMKPMAIDILSHELGHAWDFGGPKFIPRPAHFPNEAVATFFAWMTLKGRSSALLTANATTDFGGSGSGCVWTSRSSIRGMYVSAFAYASTCQWMRWTAQQVAAKQGTIADMFVAMRPADSRLTLAEEYNVAMGTVRPSYEVVGEWFLSFYADDYVPGTSPALQDKAVNIRLAERGYEWPAARVNDLGATIPITMGEPDVYIVEVTVTGATRLDVRTLAGAALPGDRIGLGLVRAK